MYEGITDVPRHFSHSVPNGGRKSYAHSTFYSEINVRAFFKRQWWVDCLLTKQPITFIITWKMTLVENVEEKMHYLGFHCSVPLADSNKLDNNRARSVLAHRRSLKWRQLPSFCQLSVLQILPTARPSVFDDYFGSDHRISLHFILATEPLNHVDYFSINFNSTPLP